MFPSTGCACSDAHSQRSKVKVRWCNINWGSILDKSSIKLFEASFSWKKACKSCLLTLPSCSKKTWPFPALLRKKAVLLSYKTLRCYLAYYNIITFCIVGKLTSAASWTFEFKPLLLVQARDCLSMQFSTPQNRSLEGPSIGQRRNVNIVPWGASEAGRQAAIPKSPQSVRSAEMVVGAEVELDLCNKKSWTVWYPQHFAGRGHTAVTQAHISCPVSHWPSESLTVTQAST